MTHLAGVAGNAPDVATVTTTPRARLRARICPAALLSADLLAFVCASCLAFAIGTAAGPPPYLRALENLTAMGAGWHGWGTFLVLVSLLGYFGGRGHYTTRVPAWTQLGDIVIATTVAFACDIFLTIAIYQRPVVPGGSAAVGAVLPCLVALRSATRHALRTVGRLVASHADRRGTGWRWPPQRQHSPPIRPLATV